MPNNDLVQSLARGLAILEWAARTEAGLSLQELADRLKLKPPTVHNLARTLVRHGYLAKTSRPILYRAGPALLQIARCAGEQARGRAAAAAMLRLHAVWPGATIVYCEPEGWELLIRLRVSPDAPGVIERPAHRLLHPYGSATSLVFQALWAEDDLCSYRQAHPFYETGAAFWKEQPVLDRALAEVRRKGYAVLTRQPRQVAFAAPVLDGDRRPAAALGISFYGAALPDRRQRAAVIKALRQAALEVAG